MPQVRQEIAMAEGTGTKQMEKLKDETTCCKCRRQYSQPKLLPCLHSVCTSCLTIREGVRETEGLQYMVTCPQCGAEAELPKTGIFSLPTSFFKVHMAESYQRLLEMEGKEERGCEECGEESTRGKVVAYCRDCDHVICGECKRRHQQVKVLSGHRMESLEECKRNLQSQTASHDNPSNILPPTLLCQKHSKSLDMYCRTCSVLVCEECTTAEHTQPRHKLGYIQSLVKHHKSELKQSLAVVKEMHVTAVKAIGTATASRDAVAQQEKEMCTIINESFDELARKLDECRQNLISATKEAVATRSSQVSQQLKMLETKAEELENLTQVCEQTLGHANDQEFMALRRNLSTKIKEVCVHWHESAPLLEDSNPSCVLLPFSTTWKLMSIFTSHTNDHHSLCPSKSTLSRTQLEVGKEARVIIHACYASGKACLEKVKIEVEVSRTRVGESVPATITSGIELGTHVVSFLPDTRGQYEISVKFGGKDFSNSPLRLSTAPSQIAWETPRLVIVNQDWPWAVACTNNRELYVTRNYHHTIAVLDKDGQLIKTIGIKGQKPGSLWSPTGIAVDSQEGAIYVADGLDSGRIQKLNLHGQLLAIYTGLVRPCGVLLSKRSGHVYVCDRQNKSIIVLDKDLNLVKTFGELSRNADEYQEVLGSLSAPHSLAEDVDGNIYVTDSDNACVLVFDPEATYTRTINHPYSDMFAPTGICIQEDLVYVADCGDNQVVVFRRNGEFVNSYGSFGQMEGQFYTPLGVAVDVDGFIYVCDHCNARIQVY